MAQSTFTGFFHVCYHFFRLISIPLGSPFFPGFEPYSKNQFSQCIDELLEFSDRSHFSWIDGVPSYFSTKWRCSTSKVMPCPSFGLLPAKAQPWEFHGNPRGAGHIRAPGTVTGLPPSVHLLLGRPLCQRQSVHLLPPSS